MPTEGQAVVVGILSRHKQAIEDMRAVLRDPAGGRRSSEEAKTWKSGRDSWLRKVANRGTLAKVL